MNVILPCKCFQSYTFVLFEPQWVNVHTLSNETGETSTRQLSAAHISPLLATGET